MAAVFVDHFVWRRGFDSAMSSAIVLTILWVAGAVALYRAAPVIARRICARIPAELAFPFGLSEKAVSRLCDVFVFLFLFVAFLLRAVGGLSSGAGPSQAIFGLFGPLAVLTALWRREVAVLKRAFGVRRKGS